MMMHGGDGDRGGVEMKTGGQEIVHGREDGDCVLGRGFGGAGLIRLDGGGEGDGQAGSGEFRCLQLAVDAQVVLAEGSGPGNGNAQRVLAHGWGVQPCGAGFWAACSD